MVGLAVAAVHIKPAEELLLVEGLAIELLDDVLELAGDQEAIAVLIDLLEQSLDYLFVVGDDGIVPSGVIAGGGSGSSRCADGLREGPGRPSAARRPGRATARWRVELPNSWGAAFTAPIAPHCGC